MWDNIWSSFQKALVLIAEPTELMSEIVSTTMFMALNSTLWASLLGILIGCLVAIKDFRGKKIVVTVIRTLMGLPPVAVGIIIYMLFSGTGPFGKLGLIYSIKLMVIAQVVLITPIVAGMVETSLSPVAASMSNTMNGLNMNPFKKGRLLLNEGKFQIVSTVLFAFARSTAEVGAVQIVGGNILHSTRIMTTTIMMNYNSGSFELAVALGIVLIIISLTVNIVATLLTLAFKKR